MQSKEPFLLKKFLCDIKYSGSDIFQDSVLSNKSFMPTVTKLSYDWEILSDLRRKYNSRNIFVKKSKLKENRDLAGMETKNLADLLCKISESFCHLTNIFTKSRVNFQIYCRKCNPL